MKPNSRKPASTTNADYIERQPAVHLTRKGLQLTLERIAESKDCPFTPANIPWLREELLRVGKHYAIRGGLSVTVKRSKKRQVTEAQMNGEMAEKFRQVLHSERMNANHKVLSMLGPGSKEWKTLTQVARQAEQFSEAMGMQFVDGARRFIQIGFKLMKTYRLANFQYLAERILIYANCENELAKDDRPEHTRRLYDAYLSEIRSGGSIAIPFDDDPVKYSEFLKVREYADAVKASYEDWIQAQFEGLAFIGVVPEVSQLWGQEAATRYSKAVYRWKQ